jgi:methylated-DNA-[protein]-cysteine S-methyltransferase
LPQLSLHSPVGDLTLSQEEDGLVALDWGWGRDQSETELLCRGRQQLHEYFDGSRVFFDLNLTPHGTAYQRRVWDVLCAMPPGQTRTYAEVAVMAGGSARAVGGAMARNPLPIFIPCHRVVASNGPGGYSGGEGLPTKSFLLALERRGRTFSPTDQPQPEYP